MLLRVGVRSADKTPLMFAIANYVRQKMQVKTEEDVKRLVNSIKTVAAKEMERYNADRAHVVHILTPEAKPYRREHLIAVQRDDTYYFFSFLAKEHFYATAKDDKEQTLENFASPSNPLHTVSSSLRFEGPQKKTSLEVAAPEADSDK